jgi:hypothetical protein
VKMVKLVKVRWDLRPPNIKDRLPPSAATTRVVQKCERFDYSVVHKVAKRRKKKGGRQKKKVASRKCPDVQSREGETGDRSERLGPEIAEIVSLSRPAKESQQQSACRSDEQMKVNPNDIELYDQDKTNSTADGERNQESADGSQDRRKSTGDKHGSRQQGPDKKSDLWDKQQEGEKNRKAILLQDSADKDEKGDHLNRDKNEKNLTKTETERKGPQQRTEIKNAVRDKRKHSPGVKKLSKDKQEAKEQARDQLGQSLDNNTETPEHRNKQSLDRKDSDCQDTISRSSRSRPEKGPTRINLCQKFSSTDTVSQPTAAPVYSQNIESSVLGIAKNNGNPVLGLVKNNGNPELAVPTPVTSEEIDSELVDMASQLDYSGGFGDFDNDDSDSDEAAVSTATSPRWRPPTVDADKPTLVASNSLLPSSNCGILNSRRQILRLKWCGDEEGGAGGNILDLGEYTAQQLLLRAQRVREAAARHAEAETIEAKSPIICDLLRNDFLQLWLI